MRGRKTSRGRNGKDKERKLSRGRRVETKRRNRDGARGVGRPCALSRAAPPGRPYISTPTLYTPRASKEYMHSCVRWRKPTQRWRGSSLDAAGRRATPHGVGVATSSANRRRRKPLLRSAFLDEASPRAPNTRGRRRDRETPDSREWRAKDCDADSRPRDASRSSREIETPNPAAASSYAPPSLDVWRMDVRHRSSLSSSRVSSWRFSFPGRAFFPVYPFLAFASSPISVSLSPRCVERSVHDSADERDRAHPLWTSLVACRPSGAVILVRREDGTGVPSVIDDPSIALPSPRCAVLDVHFRRIPRQISHIGWFQLAMLE